MSEDQTARNGSTHPVSRSASGPSHAPALEVRGLTKSFGGAAALSDVDVTFRAGEVHALLGENGAGKSTLVKIVSGVVQADSGSISGEAHDAGDVFMVFQELSVVPEMSLFDNLVLADRGKRSFFVSYRRLRDRAERCLSGAGLGGVELTQPAASLSLAQRQLLEIARGLMADARVLILDEPTATLSDVEISKVHEVVRDLCRRGTAVVYITHRLGEVFNLADRVTVMRGGRVVASDVVDEFSMATLVHHMLGEVTSESRMSHARRDQGADGPTLTARGLSLLGRYEPLTIRFRAGQIVAFFGQIGSGADDVVRTLAGIQGKSGGHLQLNDHELELGDRARAQGAGIAYISPDRVNEGVFLNASISRNISSGALGLVTSRTVIRRALESDLARTIAKRVALDSSRIQEPVAVLSGGNQQKVAIGRALATDPKILVLDEPTRGVDIGARAEIYRGLRALADQATLVIAYSSDIVEIRELADRVITMYRGRVVGEHAIGDTDDAQLMAEILHGAAS